MNNTTPEPLPKPAAPEPSEREKRVCSEWMLLTNPMFSEADRLEMAAGAINFRDDVIANLRRRLDAALAAPVPAAPSESIQAVREAVALLHDKGLHTEAVALGAHLKKIEGALAVPAVVEPCAWKEDEDGNWWTGCGEGHVFTDGGPVENGAMFCCYCGSALASVTGSEQDRPVEGKS